MAISEVSLIPNTGSKKLKIESEKQSVSIILRVRVIEFVSIFLTRYDLINYELVSKKNLNNTAEAWKVLSKRDEYHADWYDAEKTKYKEKNNYIISLLFSKIVQFSFNFSSAIELDEEIKKYPYFPNIHTYAEAAIGCARTVPFIFSDKLLKSIDNISDIAFEGIKQKKWSGDIFLTERFMHIDVRRSNLLDISVIELSREYFIKGLKANGVIKGYFSKVFNDTESFSQAFEVAIIIARRGYFKYLDDVLYTYYEKVDTINLIKWKKEYGPFPPFLYWMAERLPETPENKDEKIRLYEEAYKNYNVQAPFYVIIRAFFSKLTLKKYNELDELIEKMQKYYPKIKNDYFIALARIQQNKFEEAEQIFLKNQIPSRSSSIISLPKFAFKGEYQEYANKEDALLYFTIIKIYLKKVDDVNNIFKFWTIDRYAFLKFLKLISMFSQKEFVISFCSQYIDQEILYEMGCVLQNKETREHYEIDFEEADYCAWLILSAWYQKSDKRKKDTKEVKEFLNKYDQKRPYESLSASHMLIINKPFK